MQYAGISDHSQTAAYAHGVKEKEVEKYLCHMQQIEKEFEDFSIFKGINQIFFQMETWITAAKPWPGLIL
ncbi:MAG: hypothetical protein U5N58_08175 [Actinomycetota bacterium]|nr:hypothetical protein [Actinomycetota bacterium]